MQPLRALLLRHRALAALIVAAALCLKLLVPAGYMLDSGATSITVRLCDDGLGKVITKQITLPANGAANDHPGDPAGKSAAPECPYTALSLATLGGADGLVLAAALAVILMLGVAPMRAPRLRHAAHIRPPLRAPPTPA